VRGCIVAESLVNDHRNASWWMGCLSAGVLDRNLREIYGSPDLISRRKQAYLGLLEHFKREHGDDQPVIIARSPCRINLMGMHVEHRGGYVNYVTHSREILAAASVGEEGVFHMTDVRSESFPKRSFSLEEEISLGDWSDWLKYIESPGVVDRVSGSQGDWSNYVKAAVLRLQNYFGQERLEPLDMAFLGDIPTSSGLSSSSAMVVVTALLTLAASGLSIDRKKLVTLCGEAEWYVGTRGGAGDHAAMLFCKRGTICHLRFFPFEVEEYLPLPRGSDVVILNSMKSAHKAGDILDAYNETIAAYQMVLMLAKDAMIHLGFPRGIIEGTRHLRDINPERIPLPDIYRLLRSLPRRATRRQLLERFPRRRQELERIFRTHKEPKEGYRIRDVALFGISECERGKRFAEIVKSGDLTTLGRLMLIEHDGDRVVRFDESTGKWVRWAREVTDEMLDALISDSSSHDSERLRSSLLHLQPGRYGCSSPELDEMVEIARSIPGVYGAGLTGAGFGGCIRALVRKGAVEDLLKTMKKRYYDPRGLPQGGEVVSTVGAACVLSPEGGAT